MQYSQSQGPRDFVVEYSTDGSSWTPVSGVGTVTLAANWTSGVVSSVSLDASLDDQPIVYLRWKRSSTSGVGIPPFHLNGKYSGIDNILIEGSA
jgi:hypothetical protein